MKPTRILLALILSLPVIPTHAGLMDWLFGPDNYWECLLDRMPGTLTYGGSMEHISQCSAEFPDKMNYRPGRGLFQPKTFEDCLEKYGKGTDEVLARQSIREACYFLFSPN